MRCRCGGPGSDDPITVIGNPALFPPAVWPKWQRIPNKERP